MHVLAELHDLHPAHRHVRRAAQQEGTLFVNMPVLDAQGTLVLEAGRLALFDNQRADQATA